MRSKDLRMRSKDLTMRSKDLRMRSKDLWMQRYEYLGIDRSVDVQILKFVD